MIEWLIAFPVPLSPSIGRGIPQSPIKFEVDWPHDAGVEIGGYTLIFNDTKVQSFAKMSIHGGYKCAAGSVVSNF